jgi:hypothetical protein
MTFEVYDGRATLPTLESYARDNPQSKGWMEVVSVGNGSSTCRVIKQVANPPRQGDPIFNFILRRDRPNHFAVLGDFANAPRKTLVDLIQQWGGVIDPSPTPDTDYVILGAPPADPNARSTYDVAKAQAEQLKRPILTEDRFDLLIRYYTPGSTKP